MTYDVAIIGGGILGLATGRALMNSHPGLALSIIEKEPAVGQHQTGRNSGVIHSGLYYLPGSLKARLCVRGADILVEYCRDRGIAFAREGKVVVATQPSETGRLDELERRGTANGLRGLERIGRARLRELEPHAAGREALWVPTTGTVDFGEVAGNMAAELAEKGATIAAGAPVSQIVSERGGVRLVHGIETEARLVLNCAGLYSDRVAEMMGVEPPVRIVPFRGEYLTLRQEASRLVRNSIYPVPDPDLPFLGVHLTRRISGVVEAGPNAVLAFAREGYRRSTIRPGELLDTLRYPGTRRMMRNHWRSGLAEMWRSLSRSAFVRSVRKLVPEVTSRDIQRGNAGVRAQAITPDGRLVDDFSIVTTERAVHVLNAPSPGATASLAIGEHIAGIVAGLLDR